MNVENIFEYAVENKLRFNYKGSITVEDLYDLSVDDLDSIYKSLRREAKRAEEESLLDTKTNEDISLGVKIEIVKAIVSKKLAQVEARKVAAKNREQRKKILEIIAQKENESLSNMSIEQLNQLLEQMN